MVLLGAVVTYFTCCFKTDCQDIPKILAKTPILTNNHPDIVTAVPIVFY